MVANGSWRLPGLGVAIALCVAFALGCGFPRAGFADTGGDAPGTAEGCANATVPAIVASARTMGNAVVCLVNRARASYGLPPLVQAHSLTLLAQRYTSEMVSRHFFSHTAPNGSTPGARIAAAGYLWSWEGENIASGFPTPLSVVSDWMHSRGHCFNMLAPVFRNIGVGVSPHPVAYATEPATWTQDFGLRRGQSSLSTNWRPADSCPH